MKKTQLLNLKWMMAVLVLAPAWVFGQVHAEWAKRLNATTRLSADRANALVLDGEGNVYVTGGSGGHYGTVKYTKSGLKRWQSQYSGRGNSTEEATALAVDRLGNVYVTGWSATVKYDRNGAQLWTATDGPFAEAIAVDASGNVYVAGTDATVKYDGQGVKIWEAKFNGTAAAIALDRAGNVYVTGRTLANGPGANTEDIATLKYDATGVLVWSAIHNGSVFEGATALALDTSGNVYVTGSGGNKSAEENFTTLKYTAKGQRSWVAVAKAPGKGQANGLALDAAGNVYVTGGMGGSFVTLKYDGKGVQQWSRSYAGGVAADIAVDAAANVYITGENGGDYATLKYNSAGLQLWVKKYNGTAGQADRPYCLAVGRDGSVYVTGESVETGTLSDFTTIKYSKDGSEKWVRKNNGIRNGDDRAYDLALDAKGAVLVAGQALGSGGSLDLATIKLAPDGSVAWSGLYNGSANGDDQAVAVAADAQGNVYVTGQSDGLETAGDFVTLKYDTRGSVKWVKRYNGSGNDIDRPADLAVDALGNVYVTGTATGDSSLGDFATVKYDKTGAQLWVAVYDNGGYDEAAALAVDAAGNVYVTGSSPGTGTSRDFATLKYSKDGVRQWVARYNGPAGSDDRAVGLALDAGGNVLVTGLSRGISSGFDYATVKYSPAGTRIWEARYNGPAWGWDQPVAVAADGAGNVYVAGYSSNGGTAVTGWDLVTLKYSAAGAELWEKRYNSPANREEKARSLAVDAAGNVYVTGFCYTNYTSRLDYITLQYTPQGDQAWVHTYNGAGSADDEAHALVLDQNGSLYVTGQSVGQGTDYDMVTIKYSPTPEAPVTALPPAEESEGRAALLPEDLRLALYPNPVATSARVRYELPAAGRLSIRLYDLLGREVRLLHDAAAPAGAGQAVVDASGLQKGVYYYRVRLQNGQQVWQQTGKLTVTR
ncbi:SBBP repeat-containing protein [Paraflavisolibacter sp. H34]|uniref:SBBP repeat-containing protein n=1 Tax=Huijunlia imazamoxiresistens TaxID=3127457 RepID=UPI00301652AD